MLIERAKKLIAEYCFQEFGENAKVDFSDLSKIPIAYTTTEDEKHEIQVNVNLVGFRIETFVDDTCIQTDKYDSLGEMVEDVLPYLSFDELVCVDEEDLKTVDELIANAMTKSEIGDTVNENDRYRG